MPAVATVPVDPFLERGDRRQGRDSFRNGTPARASSAGAVEVRNPSPSVYHISPAFYATASSTRASGSSPTSVPSPYVVNHKRRDFPPPVGNRVAEPEERGNGGEVDGDGLVVEEEGKVSDSNGVVLEEEGKVNDSNGDVVMVNEGGEGGLREEEPTEDDFDDFFNPRESMSVRSSSDTDEGGSSRCYGPARSINMLSSSEFYDATDDFLSDGSSSQASRFHSKIETDLRSLRLNLFEEIERRKKLEEYLIHMQNQWKNMASYFSEMGLSFPPLPTGLNGECEADSVAQLYQEVIVTKVVSEAVVRNLARAEAEEAAEAVIERKNREISRLYERLQYYEAVNREMSQRNQEATDLARRRHQKRRKKRWIWGSVGLSITIGASLLAYSFIPQASIGPHMPGANRNPEASSSL